VNQEGLSSKGATPTGAKKEAPASGPTCNEVAACHNVPPRESTLESNLNPSFTFENYVVGPFNTSALAVALSVAKKLAEGATLYLSAAQRAKARLI